MTFWELTADVPLADLLAWGMERGADRLFVVERVSSRSAATLAKRQLGATCITTVSISKWPGSELSSNATLTLAHLKNVDVFGIHTVFELQASNHLPEDVCLYRHGQSHPIFFSVTHERMAWFIADSQPKFPCRKVDKTEDLCELSALPKIKCFGLAG